jgi:hypothetical protein
VPIEVLAELLDHRNLNVTRGYYRVGEDRRRAAVDTVTAMSFDRHGNRIWRDAQALLDSEHAAIDEAVTVMRRHRATSLGMPTIRATPDTQPEATAWPATLPRPMSPTSAPTR